MDALERLVVLGSDDGDPVATIETTSHEHPREPASAAIDVPPGESLGLADDADGRRMGRRRPRHQLGERLRRHHVHDDPPRTRLMLETVFVLSCACWHLHTASSKLRDVTEGGGRQ